MSDAPILIDSGALGWTFLLSTRSNGSGELKISWDAQGRLHPEFHAGFTLPAAALESCLTRIERNGGMCQIEVPMLVGVLAGYFQRRER